MKEKSAGDELAGDREERGDAGQCGLEDGLVVGRRTARRLGQGLDGRRGRRILLGASSEAQHQLWGRRGSRVNRKKVSITLGTCAEKIGAEVITKGFIPGSHNGCGNWGRASRSGATIE